MGKAVPFDSRFENETMNKHDSILERTLIKKKQLLDVRKQQPWIILNLLGAMILSYYLNHLRDNLTLTYTVIWYSFLIVCVIFILNVAAGLFFYFKRTQLDPPVALSPNQKRVLGIKNTEAGFITSTPTAVPREKIAPSFPYIPVGSSPSSPTIKSDQFLKKGTSPLLYTSHNWD